MVFPPLGNHPAIGNFKGYPYIYGTLYGTPKKNPMMVPRYHSNRQASISSISSSLTSSVNPTGFDFFVSPTKSKSDPWAIYDIYANLYANIFHI